jgi:hypothetical protein
MRQRKPGQYTDLRRTAAKHPKPLPLPWGDRSNTVCWEVILN